MKKYSVRPSLLVLGLAVGIIANAMINPPFIGPESAAVTSTPFVLKSIVVNGNMLTVDYQKGFDTCAHLLTTDKKLTHLENLFCANKGPITVPLSKMNNLFAVGRVYYFCNGNNYQMCAQATAVNGASPSSSASSKSSASSVVASSVPSSSRSSVSSSVSTVSSAASSFRTWPNTGIDPLVSMQSCAAPKAPAHIFYVDPIKGTNAGDGSQIKPWHTLAEVVNAKLINGEDPTKGVVHAGDAIYLMNGNHGQLKLTDYVGGGAFNNTDFITIQAAPGQTPIVTGLLAQNISKWVFKGLTLQLPADRNTFPAWAGVVNIRPAADIIFTDNAVYTEADATKWTPADWIASAKNGVTYEGPCGKILNNTIKNVQFGLNVLGDKVLVDNNTISYFSVDGIDFTLSNSAITRNRILDHYPFTTDEYHNDGMQGQAHTGLLDNILIDSNTVIESTGTYPNIPLVPTGLVTKDGKNYMQGISEFDGSWAHMTITNNLIVVSAWDAITTMGASDTIIANNTIVKNSSHPEMTPWIRVDTDKTGRVTPIRSIVRNNISPALFVYHLNNFYATYTDHNITSKIDEMRWATPTIVQPQDLFVNADITKGPLDLHLKPGSPAIGAGLFLTTPAVDITGKTRNPASIDIGAYAK